MPGGSGLLDQIIERWAEVMSESLNSVEDCPSVCESACVDCLLDFRNAGYHRYLNRHVAAETIGAWGEGLAFSNDIPAALPTVLSNGGQPVNEAESTLKHILELVHQRGTTASH